MISHITDALPAIAQDIGPTRPEWTHTGPILAKCWANILC